MEFKMTENTLFPLVEISLKNGEMIQLERGAMVYHNGQINLEGKMNSNGQSGLGGAIRALGRSMASSESFFITQAKGLSDHAIIALAPGTPGAIKKLDVGLEHWRLNDGAFLAADSTVSYQMKRQKISTAFFGGTGGFFVMETSGKGTLLINAYGDIVELQLDGSQPFIIDNQHVVAWSESLEYNIKAASGMFGFTTGEGLVNEFHGRGTVLIQTRNVEALAGMLSPFITSGK
ncbi:TIGR00266 family protein [Enterococcus sp. BWB1-3]|uniref:TIGR00266 family protein n=1 Tax=unclassified Enterococcus TaxID=2608891 RepID=UPI001924C6C2|nr:MULTISPECIES: TIGR00266 family protein [unclassified Enterococcus]MBL1230414.1 TIGR00266 family protein [Enterococcus sp. BWB1-3]MCB5952328.1 TIGR00266 family protein [Enterococcus sp. BWT-B8]MCB5955702.1 TIGR00266 family protein [Enterococcus sp. CWB-B31]